MGWLLVQIMYVLILYLLVSILTLKTQQEMYALFDINQAFLMFIFQACIYYTLMQQLILKEAMTIRTSVSLNQLEEIRPT